MPELEKPAGDSPASAPAKAPETVAECVAAMPALDSGATDPKTKRLRGSAGKLTGPEWKEAEPLYDTILSKGAEGVRAVIDMLKEADDGHDYRARYALHGLGVYVARPGKDKQRAEVASAIVSSLATDKPKTVKLTLVRELVRYGDKSSAAALAGALSDAELCADAAMALVAVGAAEPLRIALPAAREPHCRMHIANALGQLKDTASAAALMRAAEDKDEGVRVSACWALARIGDASAAETLIKASNAQGWERIQATDACLLLAERLAAAGNKPVAERVYKHLTDTRTDKSESHVRQAALAALGGA
jgi:HEAT repeat protein